MFDAFAEFDILAEELTEELCDEPPYLLPIVDWESVVKGDLEAAGIM